MKKRSNAPCKSTRRIECLQVQDKRGVPASPPRGNLLDRPVASTRKHPVVTLGVAQGSSHSEAIFSATFIRPNVPLLVECAVQPSSQTDRTVRSALRIARKEVPETSAEWSCVLTASVFADADQRLWLPTPHPPLVLVNDHYLTIKNRALTVLKASAQFAQADSVSQRTTGVSEVVHQQPNDSNCRTPRSFETKCARPASQPPKELLPGPFRLPNR